MNRLIAILVVAALPLTAAAQGVRFAAVDIYLESDVPIAAWQFELNDRDAVMKVVGVEQGESNAFTRAPYYDREAVSLGEADRIIVADYTLAGIGDLPSGHFRIATVHVMLSGGDGDLDLNLVTATTYDGVRTDALASFSVRQGSEQ